MLLIATCRLFACNSANEHNTGGDSIHYIHDDTASADTSLRAANFDDTAFVKLAARYLLEDKEKADLVKRNAYSEDIKDFGMRVADQWKDLSEPLNFSILLPFQTGNRNANGKHRASTRQTSVPFYWEYEALRCLAEQPQPSRLFCLNGECRTPMPA